MFGKILGAFVGNKIAGRNSGASGALIGAAIPMIARRGLGPLGLALGAGYLAKKLFDRRRAGQPIVPGTVAQASVEGSSSTPLI